MIETARLILREIDLSRDVDAWVRTLADRQIVKYLGIEPLSRKQAEAQIATVMEHWEFRGYGFFSVEEKATQSWVGLVGPWYPQGWPKPEVGWLISPDHLRRGFAVEASRASVDFAFNSLEWTDVFHMIVEGNLGSIKVAERLGSKWISTLDKVAGIPGGTIHLYGQSRSGGHFTHA